MHGLFLGEILINTLQKMQHFKSNKWKIKIKLYSTESDIFSIKRFLFFSTLKFEKVVNMLITQFLIMSVCFHLISCQQTTLLLKWKYNLDQMKWRLEQFHNWVFVLTYKSICSGLICLLSFKRISDKQKYLPF